MNTTQIQTGAILKLAAPPVPIHADSEYYSVGAYVICDNENFIPVITDAGTFALSTNETHLYRSAKNEEGELVFIHKVEYSNYVRATNENADYVYFTSEAAAEGAGFKFSLRKNSWYLKSSEDFYGKEKLLPYHNSQRINRDTFEKYVPKYINDTDTWLLGVEVEKTDTRLQDSGEAWQLLQEYGWSKESDGSLSSGGYELVSPILPLFDNVRIAAALMPVKAWIDGRSDSSCGGHITISCRTLTTHELLTKLRHIAPLLYAIYPNRIDNRFCEAKNWARYFRHEKYQAFYPKDDFQKMGGRVEIRIPSRVVNTNSLLWRIEFFQALITEIINEANLNQLAAKIGSPEASFHKLLSKQYSQEKLADKLRQIHHYAIRYKSHKNGISPSVRKRINITMNTEVFTDVN